MDMVSYNTGYSIINECSSRFCHTCTINSEVMMGFIERVCWMVFGAWLALGMPTAGIKEQLIVWLSA
jgi:hypothetical protein